METYLSRNNAYWQKGYEADNVESFVFRPYGRIFKYEFGLSGEKGEKLLEGFYDAKFREDEGGSFHYTFVGRKPR